MIDHAVVLAVGNAAHQSKLIYNRTRAMLPALGKPLVVRVMDRLLRAGIHRFTVIVGEKEGGAAAYLDAHWAAGASVNFVLQSSKHTLAQTLSEVAEGASTPFLLTSYNTFAHLNFADRLSRRFAGLVDIPLLLGGAGASLSFEPFSHYAMFDDESRVLAVSEQQTAKAYLLTDFSVCGAGFRDFLIRLPSLDGGMRYADLAHIYERYIHDGGLASIVSTSWALQITHDVDLLTLNHHLLDEEQDAHILSEIPSSVHIVPPVRIDPQVSVGQRAHIGPYVYLENGCSVGEDSRIENALILNKVRIGAGETVSAAIVATRARIHV